MNCLSGAVRVNLPSGPFDRLIIAVCGSRSGRDLDKAAELGLALVDGEKVAVPAVAQLPLTLECRVIYRQTEDNALLPPEIRARFYPSVERSHDTDKDNHVVYFGEILSAYLLGCPAALAVVVALCRLLTRAFGVNAVALLPRRPRRRRPIHPATGLYADQLALP